MLDIIIGAGDGIRTRVTFLSRDFKSLASAGSATPAYFIQLTHVIVYKLDKFHNCLYKKYFKELLLATQL